MRSDETRTRFLAAIAERVVGREVAEVHMFAPIKQGGLESGVAVVAVGAESGEPTAESDLSTASNRLTVYTATYRLTLKGPERGRWEFSMVAEADAPLVTVDAVVRGVQRRSGDAEDPEKLSGDDVRQIVASATPAGTPTKS